MTALDVERITKERNSVQGKENFHNGMNFEFRILRSLKKNPQVVVVLRSAGSHGTIDLYALMSDGRQWFITVKRNGCWSSKEMADLKRLSKSLPDRTLIKMAYYVSPRKYVMENYRG